MKSLSKLSTAFAATVALNACGPTQPAEIPQKAMTEVRSNVDEALAQIGTDKQGIQAGPNPDMLYSVVCGEGLIEDQTRIDVHIAAARELLEYACSGDSSSYFPILHDKDGQFGFTICERVMMPRTVICNGKPMRLEDPK